MACPSNEETGVVEVDRLKAEAFEGARVRGAISGDLADADSAHDTRADVVESSESSGQVLSQTPNFVSL